MSGSVVTLRRIGTGVEQPAESKPKPAVAVRRSIGPGKKQKLLKRHLAVVHSLLPGQYRESFGLKPDYPMAAPNYAQQRRELALKIGLGRPKKPERRRRKKTSVKRSRAEVG